MSNLAIRVENLGKSYTLSHQSNQNIKYKTLREDLVAAMRWPLRRLKGVQAEQKEQFWALKDVSFEVKQGEVLGLIGRNGAGKSTLLKILSRITEPTTGYADLYGRVGCLLEAGTGFHAELTGRENIFLSGSILGMTRREVQRKFDEIVDFAGVENFLDTPVKRYSTGMYVRLAFAVAAHLEPEILIVDEVLAVGDAQFQKKCLGKMDDVSKSGRTVIFVSHNMSAIAQLCTKALYLKAGEIIATGNVDNIVSDYLLNEANSTTTVELVRDAAEVRKSKRFFFKKIALINHEEVATAELDLRYPFYLELEYEATEALSHVELAVRVDTSNGQPVFTTHQSDCSPESIRREPGTHKLRLKFPAALLMPGTYFLSINAQEPLVEMFDIYEQVLSFTINDVKTRYVQYEQQYQKIGVVLIDVPWTEFD